MSVDRGRFADLHIARLRLRDLQFGHQVIRLDHLGQHGPGRNVFSHMQRQFHEHAIDPGTNFQGVELFLLQPGQNPHLLHFGLLLGQLRIDRLLGAVQPLPFETIASGELV